jgi:hypothetical protein
MKPKWLIQTNMDGVDTNPMIAKVTAQGMTAHTIECRLGQHIDFDVYDPTDCIICYGDIDFVRQARQRARFIPGVWSNFENMKCSTYYAYLGKYLLNRCYMMMPIGDLLERWDDLTTVFQLSLFVRPDDGVKSFTGYIVAPNEKHKIQALVQSIGPETLIVVAPEKKITAEWRFVICDKQVITGCQYLPIECSDLPPPLSFRLAGIIASQEWQPDLCYTVDIAESEGNMYLLEINSFSCAGFYDCNMDYIVKHASKAALNEWKQYHVS